MTTPMLNQEQLYQEAMSSLLKKVRGNERETKGFVRKSPDDLRTATIKKLPHDLQETYAVMRLHQNPPDPKCKSACSGMEIRAWEEVIRMQQTASKATSKAIRSWVSTEPIALSKTKSARISSPMRRGRRQQWR